MSRAHTLKTHTTYYNDVINGVKTFEVRLNDRDFKVGDTLILVEVDPHLNMRETGRRCPYIVNYILSDTFPGLQAGYVAMSIVPLSSIKFDNQVEATIATRRTAIFTSSASA